MVKERGILVSGYISNVELRAFAPDFNMTERIALRFLP